MEQPPNTAAPASGLSDSNVGLGMNYKIRRDVLNMPLTMWQKLPDGDIYEGTAKNFLTNIGLPGGKSAFFNDEEKRFFAEIYALGRMVPNDLGNRRDAGPIGGASELTDGLAGKRTE